MNFCFEAEAITKLTNKTGYSCPHFAGTDPCLAVINKIGNK